MSLEHHIHNEPPVGPTLPVTAGNGMPVGASAPKTEALLARARKADEIARNIEKTRVLASVAQLLRSSRLFGPEDLAALAPAAERVRAAWERLRQETAEAQIAFEREGMNLPD